MTGAGSFLPRRSFPVDISKVIYWPFYTDQGAAELCLLWAFLAVDNGLEVHHITVDLAFQGFEIACIQKA